MHRKRLYVVGNFERFLVERGFVGGYRAFGVAYLRNDVVEGFSVCRFCGYQALCSAFPSRCFASLSSSAASWKATSGDALLSADICACKFFIWRRNWVSSIFPTGFPASISSPSSTCSSTIFPATSLETTVSVVSIVPEAKGASGFSQAHGRSAADNVNILAAIATAPSLRANPKGTSRSR